MKDSYVNYLSEVNSLASIDVQKFWIGQDLKPQQKPRWWLSRLVYRLFYFLNLTIPHKDEALFRAFNRIDEMLQKDPALLSHKDFSSSLKKFCENIKTIKKVRKKQAKESWISDTLKKIEEVEKKSLTLEQIQPKPETKVQPQPQATNTLQTLSEISQKSMPGASAVEQNQNKNEKSTPELTPTMPSIEKGGEAPTPIINTESVESKELTGTPKESVNITISLHQLVANPKADLQEIHKLLEKDAVNEAKDGTVDKKNAKVDEVDEQGLNVIQNALLTGHGDPIIELLIGYSYDTVLCEGYKTLFKSKTTELDKELSDKENTIRKKYGSNANRQSARASNEFSQYIMNLQAPSRLDTVDPKLNLLSDKLNDLPDEDGNNFWHLLAAKDPRTNEHQDYLHNWIVPSAKSKLSAANHKGENPILVAYENMNWRFLNVVIDPLLAHDIVDWDAPSMKNLIPDIVKKTLMLSQELLEPEDEIKLQEVPCMLVKLHPRLIGEIDRDSAQKAMETEIENVTSMENELTEVKNFLFQDPKILHWLGKVEQHLAKRKYQFFLDKGNELLEMIKNSPSV